MESFLGMQQAIGNRETRDVLSGETVQPKLAVGAPDDSFEKEADRMADAVMARPSGGGEDDPSIGLAPRSRAQRMCAECAEEEDEMVRTKSLPGAPETRSPVGLRDRLGHLRGRGRPLSPAARSFFEPRFDHDFSDVRVHSGDTAAEAARSIGARAFTVGREVVFGAGEYEPESRAGRHLLAHELTHVVQQHQAPNLTEAASKIGLEGLERSTDAVPSVRSSARPPAVQRKIGPEDVASEMVGRDFKLAEAFTVSGTTLPAGHQVTIVTWTNASENVTARSPLVLSADGSQLPISIPKRLLEPVHAAVAGVDPYSADVTGQASAVKKAEKELSNWEAKESSYKTEKAKKLFLAERQRLRDLLKTKRTVLNRKLIQQTMFNRFDSVIKSEVDTANTKHGLKGKDKLDPNLVKSMLFQETQLGTAGEHLEVPPSHPVKSRFNLGQVIDSSGLALLTMLEQEKPEWVVAFSLMDLRKDLAEAQKERATLRKKKTLTATERTRLTELDGLAKQNWEVFIWTYKIGLVGFSDAINAFFGSNPGTPFNMDYKFWIHMAVLWLFEKKTKGHTWAEAIRAYNGSGAKAKHYRDAVVKRGKDAAAAAKAGKELIPGGI